MPNSSHGDAMHASSLVILFISLVIAGCSNNDSKHSDDTRQITTSDNGTTVKSTAFPLATESDPTPAPANPTPAPANPTPAPANPTPALANPTPAPANPTPELANLKLGQNDPSFLEGIDGTGDLYTKIETSHGTFTCELFEKKAQNTVLNFVGLARGLKPFRDATTGAVVSRPFYNGITFHRVIPKFMIQTGAPNGNGTYNPGYGFANEIVSELVHDRGGILSMANTGEPNSNGSQFFITEVQTPGLNGKHPIFGACAEVDLVREIARVPTGPHNKPTTPVTITNVGFFRK